MRFAEPVTVATDYALAVLAAWLGVRLWRLARDERRSSTAAWALAFFCTAAGAALGGAWHGLAPTLSATSRLGLWLGTYVFVGAADFFLIAGMCLARAAASVRGWILGAAAVKLAALLVCIAIRQDLRFVAFDVAATLAVLVAFVAARPRGFAGSRSLLAGIAVTAAGGLVQRAGLGPHPCFNHNDLFHVMQMGGLYLLYRAGLELSDRERVLGIVRHTEEEP